MASGFIWYELLTSDPDAAAKFYGAVIGWTCVDSGQPGMDYRMFRMGNDFVGGLMKIPGDAAASGMPPHWLGYINVPNVDAGIQSIVAAGGAQHMPPMDIPGVGRIAMVADPQGASFYVMTPVGTGQSTSFLPGKPGHGGWHELHARDALTAYEFYSRQFGWGTERIIAGGPMGDYRIFNTGQGDAIGGMMTDPRTPRPHWLYCFNVEDIGAAQLRITAAGGSVLYGPLEVPGGNWILSATDPQGARFVALAPPRA